MTSRTRSAGLLLVLAILFLRVVIGVHFVREGEAKLTGGTWSAGGFFGAAKGPFAPFFQSLVADYDGFDRLCYDASGPPGRKINPQPTFDAWETYKETVATYYRFGDPELEQQIRRERDANRKALDEAEQAWEQGDRSESVANRLQAARVRERELRTEIETLRDQNRKADAVLASCRESLEGILWGAEDDINNYFEGWLTRRSGFVRDGEAKAEIVAEVDSLYGQQATILGDLVKARGAWLGEIDATWKVLETELNDLALPRQRAAAVAVGSIEVPLARPNAKGWMLTAIDTMVPYFDMAVGALLILGLATRFAGVMAAGFLSLIVATQLPGVPGAQDTINQIIEMGALLVLAAIGAGRFGGLDYFLSRSPLRSPEAQEVVGS